MTLSGSGPLRFRHLAPSAAERAIAESVPEMSLGGENHCYPVLVGCLDYFVVAQRTTRLDNRGDASLSGRIESIAKGEKGLAGARAPNCPSGSFLHCDTTGIDSVLLASANANGLAVLSQHDAVGVDSCC
tara:strand:- start:41 stop:430 length:390 start_codon:yes stop_codon:yes gene_type:complete